MLSVGRYNIIDHDYVEKDASRESGDLEISNNRNLLHHNSEGKNDAIGKQPKQYNAPLKVVMTVRELVPNAYKIKSIPYEERKNYSSDSNQDKTVSSGFSNVSSGYPDMSSEQLHGMQKKNNSDNEVEDNDYSLKKNVSIDFLLDDQSNEEKDFEKLERPNRTIVKPQNSEEERRTSVVKGKTTKKEKEISGK